MIRIHQSLFSPHPGAAPAGRADPSGRASQAQAQARGAQRQPPADQAVPAFG